MPVPASNGCCLDSQQQENACVLKNSSCPGYVCQGNLQGLRNCWAARNGLVSEFLLYLTDYQGERALLGSLKLPIQYILNYLTIQSVLVHKHCSYPCEWSYTNTVTYRCICCVIFCNDVIVLRISVLRIGVGIVMKCKWDSYRVLFLCIIQAVSRRSCL